MLNLDLMLHIRSLSKESNVVKIFALPEEQRGLIIENLPAGGEEGRTRAGRRKKNAVSDYLKNICGHITKKIIRQLCHNDYENHVR
jgi:hypothetical protein